MMFRDRTEAGRRLASRMTGYGSEAETLVLGLPRGGVVVAFEVAEALHAPLDVFVVRKLGVPGREELAMGAVASGDVVVKNRSVLRAVEISKSVFDAAVQRERAELTRREVVYRGQRPPRPISGRSVVLVDDGLATGATMRAAIEGVRMQQAARITVAAPLGARSACEELRQMVEIFVCLETPEPFYGVSEWYDDFRQTSDEEVHQLLEEANERLLATTRG